MLTSAVLAARDGPVTLRPRAIARVFAAAGTPRLCQQRPTVCDDVVAVGEPKATLVLPRRTEPQGLGVAARWRSVGTWNVGGQQQILGSAALEAISKHLRGEWPA
jgi:hypothetical protein